MICKSTMNSDSDDMSFQETFSTDGEDVEVNQNNSNTTHVNAGLADVFKKILKTNKPKKKKTVVLSRAKKLNDVLKKAEVVVDSGEQNINNNQKSTEISRIHEITARYISLRKKPSVLDKSREKILQKIATKGVVQLFNAVAQQQLIINKNLESAGPLLRKQEKVLQNIDKRAFLDMLMGNTRSISVNDEIIETKVEKSEDNGEDKIWRVLRDDFVMGAKLKDWDKKAEDEDCNSGVEDIN